MSAATALAASEDPWKKNSARALRQEEDVRLVRQIAGGNPDALGVLYDWYAPSILGFLKRLLGGREEAEEVLQEAMLQVWGQAAKYDPRRASVATWLGMIARSRAIDRHRSKRAYEHVVADAARAADTSTEGPVGTENVWLRELRCRLRTELAKLPLAQREVIEALYFRGLTQVEAAQALNTPLGTIKTRARLAMRRLHRHLRSDLDTFL